MHDAVIGIAIIWILFAFILAIIFFISSFKKQIKYYDEHPKEDPKGIVKYIIKKRKNFRIITALFVFCFLIYIIYKIITPISIDSFTIQTDMEKPWTTFVTDVNGDGKITITDVTGWFVWIFFLPGNCIIFLALVYLPKMSQFLEISINTYNSASSGLISLVCWVLLISILANLKNIQNYENKGSNKQR